MDKENNKMLRYILIGLISGGILFIIIGGACMGSATVTKQFTQDYTKCEKYVDPDEDSVTGTCYDYSLSNRTNCQCFMGIKLLSDFYGQVTLYYTLETFDQNRPEYKNSRDDNQLLGYFSNTPSEACEPFRYNEGKPILPCGAIADSMFTDTYTLRLRSNSDFVGMKNTGLISSKSGFNNPPGNLSLAIKDFSKPINWLNPISNLDPKNPDNNGLQNEAFIAWMNTGLKRKPAWRVDDEMEPYAQGLPKGEYILGVNYDYPVHRYGGPRILTIEAVNRRSLHWNFGAFFLSLGLLMLATIPAYFIMRIIKKKLEPLENFMQ